MQAQTPTAANKVACRISGPLRPTSRHGRNARSIAGIKSKANRGQSRGYPRYTSGNAQKPRITKAPGSSRLSANTGRPTASPSSINRIDPYTLAVMSPMPEPTSIPGSEASRLKPGSHTSLPSRVADGPLTDKRTIAIVTTVSDVAFRLHTAAMTFARRCCC